MPLSDADIDKLDQAAGRAPLTDADIDKLDAARKAGFWSGLGETLGATASKLKTNITDPHLPTGDFLKSWKDDSQGLLDAAKASADSKDYVGAAAHGFNFLMNAVPGLGKAMDDAAVGIQKADELYATDPKAAHDAANHALGALTGVVGPMAATEAIPAAVRAAPGAARAVSRAAADTGTFIATANKPLASGAAKLAVAPAVAYGASKLGIPGEAAAAAATAIGIPTAKSGIADIAASLRAKVAAVNAARAARSAEAAPVVPESAAPTPEEAPPQPAANPYSSTSDPAALATRATAGDAAARAARSAEAAPVVPESAAPTPEEAPPQPAANPYSSTSDPAALATRATAGDASLAGANPLGTMPADLGPEPVDPYEAQNNRRLLGGRQPGESVIDSERRQAWEKTAAAYAPPTPAPEAAASSAPQSAAASAADAPVASDTPRQAAVRKAIGDKGLAMNMTKDARLADWAAGQDKPITADQVEAMSNDQFAQFQKDVPTGKMNARTGRPTLHTPRTDAPDFAARKQDLADLMRSRETTAAATTNAAALDAKGVSYQQAAKMTQDQLGVKSALEQANTLFQLKKIQLAKPPSALDIATQRADQLTK